MLICVLKQVVFHTTTQFYTIFSLTHHGIPHIKRTLSESHTKNYKCNKEKIIKIHH